MQHVQWEQDSKAGNCAYSGRLPWKKYETNIEQNTKLLTHYINSEKSTSVIERLKLVNVTLSNSMFESCI